MTEESQQRYQAAVRLLEEGSADEAAQIFQSLADDFPSRPEYLLGLYNVAVQLGELEAAISPLRRLLQLTDGSPGVRRQLSMVLNNLGLRLGDSEDFSAARQRLESAVEVDPRNDLAWFNLGIVCRQAGWLQDAARAFQHAVDLQPGNPEYLLALGHAQKVADPATADAALTRLLTRLPGEPGLRLAILELVLELRGREAALGFLRDHVEPGAAPEPDEWPYFARLQERLQLLEEAAETTRRCVARQPERRELRLTLAWRLNQAGHFHAAKAEYARLSDDEPGYCYPLIASRLLLPGVYGDLSDLHSVRQGYGLGLSELEERLGRDGGSRVSDLADLAWSNFYLAYQGEDDVQLQRRYGRLLGRLAAPWQQELKPPRQNRPRRRIAVVSRFLRDCTVGHYFFSWIEALAKAGHEVVPVQLGPLDDGFTARIESLCGTLVRVREGMDRKLAAVRDLQADMIIYPELGMDADTYLLAAFRLAPVQLCGWGHPSTTGLASIDYYLSCEQMEPAGAEQQYTETLLSLPGIGTAYRPGESGAAGSRSDFGLPEEVPLYLFPHSSFKVHPDNDAMIADLLALDPDGLLVLCEGANPCFSRLLFDRLERVLRGYGLDARARVRRIPPMDRATFLRLNRCCSVMLDCLRWNGGNTSLDALAAGLPVVTTPGALMRSRQTTAMLSALGCEELVCNDPQAMVQKAVHVAADATWRHVLRRRIRDRSGALFDRPEAPQRLVRLVNELL